MLISERFSGTIWSPPHQREREITPESRPASAVAGDDGKKNGANNHVTNGVTEHALGTRPSSALNVLELLGVATPNGKYIRSSLEGD